MGSKLNWFLAGAVTALTAAAISQELAKPSEERTWKGRVAGVPYSFRLDEWADAANEYWNPDSDQILTPHVIGLGWGVNFAALSRAAQRFLGQADIAPRPVEPATPPGRASAPVGE
ncbi:MAG TPA: hypothetical protein VF808_17540 [Ktedonobacterales bacterium]